MLPIQTDEIIKIKIMKLRVSMLGIFKSLDIDTTNSTPQCNIHPDMRQTTSDRRSERSLKNDTFARCLLEDTEMTYAPASLRLHKYESRNA